MNKQEYLLTVLSEELSEVQQEISKILRFGPDSKDDRPGGKLTTNSENMEIEFMEALSVLDMIRGLGISEQPKNFAAIRKDKIARVNRYLKISENIGTLKP